MKTVSHIRLWDLLTSYLYIFFFSFVYNQHLRIAQNAEELETEMDVVKGKKDVILLYTKGFGSEGI